LTDLIGCYIIIVKRKEKRESRGCVYQGVAVKIEKGKSKLDILPAALLLVLAHLL
jgi:hypothetical protein